MALWILPNTAGAAATSITLSGSTNSPTYALERLISGPRSSMWKCEPFGSVARIYYNLPAVFTFTHCVIARADLMMTEEGSQISVGYGADLGDPIDAKGGPLSAADMVGIKVDGKPHGQDVAFEFLPPVTADVFQIALSHVSGTQAAMLSKVYFSEGLLIGDGPKPGPQWSARRDGGPEYVKPLLGYEEYAVTDAISFRWEHVTLAELRAFEALPWNWPVFLWDTDGDIFSHKLEHVLLVDPYTWVRVGDDSFTLEVTFRRLAHYA